MAREANVHCSWCIYTYLESVRAGTCAVALQTEDGLVHIQWWSREVENAAEPEFDEIVFPEEAEWVKVRHATPLIDVCAADQSLGGPAVHAGWLS